MSDEDDHLDEIINNLVQISSQLEAQNLKTYCAPKGLMKNIE